MVRLVRNIDRLLHCSFPTTTIALRSAMMQSIPYNPVASQSKKRPRVSWRKVTPLNPVKRPRILIHFRHHSGDPRTCRRSCEIQPFYLHGPCSEGVLHRRPLNYKVLGGPAWPWRAFLRLSDTVSSFKKFWWRWAIKLHTLLFSVEVIPQLMRNWTIGVPEHLAPWLPTTPRVSTVPEHAAEESEV
jgi:hypothetical protein